ncbi:cell division protein PerM [Jatrophihabitans fulvus]
MPSAQPPERRTSARPAVRPTARRARPPRPLALSAAWTGVVSALVACVVAVGTVAVVWLPASGGSGSGDSAVRAGVLTFLAGLHGGVTVDGVPTAFVPLGITLLIVLVAWRAGASVVATAAELGETRTATLAQAVLAQSGAFAVTAAVLAGLGTLGTSSASVPGALVAGFVLCALAAGGAVARHAGLAADLVPARAVRVVRGAVAVLALHLGAGALLVAGAVVVHHDRVSTLTSEVGGGFSSVPVLLLGILAAPNAVVAASGYLSGAGFAVGAGSHVGLTSHTTGTVPAFPLLGALPEGSGATWPVWALAVVTPLAGGVVLAVLARRGASSVEAWRTVGGALVLVAAAATVFAWQAGGAVGSGRLHAVGVSPWRYGLLLAAAIGVVASAVLGLAAAVQGAVGRERDERPGLRETFAALSGVEEYDTDRYRDDHDRYEDEDGDARTDDDDAGPADDADDEDDAEDADAEDADEPGRRAG